MGTLEIVTHCYRYTTLLRHQLSSLIIWPPLDLHIKATVFYTAEDERTKQALERFRGYQVPNITWNWQDQEPGLLCHRSIGRNQAALASEADWVWFTDADYWFTHECWSAFAQLGPVDGPLIYPRRVHVHRRHSFGDALIENSRKSPGLVFAEFRKFRAERLSRAIGGVQIVKGDVCRSRGYLKDNSRAQRRLETAKWARCREDVWFRRSLGTKGQGVDLPGVYRIRHSEVGRVTEGLQL